jgi:predicted acyltransferase
MAQLLKPWIARTLRTHLGTGPFAGPYGGILMSVCILLVLWLFCYWMYRRKLFLRI